MVNILKNEKKFKVIFFIKKTEINEFDIPF